MVAKVNKDVQFHDVVMCMFVVCQWKCLFSVLFLRFYNVTFTINRCIGQLQLQVRGDTFLLRIIFAGRAMLSGVRWCPFVNQCPKLKAYASEPTVLSLRQNKLFCVVQQYQLTFCLHTFVIINVLLQNMLSSFYSSVAFNVNILKLTSKFF